jgi:hypothetical protein
VKFISAILAAGAAALLAAAPVSASAATAAHAAARSPQKYCVIEIATIRPSQAQSRVVLGACSTSHAPGSTLPAGVSPQKPVRLVEFFEGPDYSGRNISIYVSSGPCTVVKYLFPSLKKLNGAIGGISSYRLFSNCRVASYWWNTGFRGPKKGPIRGSNPYVGAPWAGHLWSMKIWA